MCYLVKSLGLLCSQSQLTLIYTTLVFRGSDLWAGLVL